MSTLNAITDHINGIKTSFFGLPRWQQITIGVISLGITYKTIQYVKPKKKKKKEPYYPNVPHYKAEMVVNCKNKLGECCVWDDKKQLVCWIDNRGSKYWTYDPKTKESKSYDLPEKPGSFALCEDESILMCFTHGPAFYDPSTQKFSKRLFEFEPEQRSMMNDGRCDRYGRFVVGGVMEFYIDATNPFGKFINFFRNIWLYMYGKRSSIYRINQDLSVQHIIDGIMCSNSICFSLDGKTMYFTDSFVKEIRKLDYFEDNTKPNNDQVFTDKFRGMADGGCVDSNGNLWSTQFANSTVGCFDANGNIIMVVDVPEKHVTCCCFGGEKLDTLYINTLNGALMGIKDDSAKDVGNLYAVKLDNVTGLKENRFKGRAPSTISLTAEQWK